MTARRSPSPSPTVTLDPRPKAELYRSSSEESIRAIHHAVLFPSSPYAGRVSYIRRTFESDAELIRRQTVAIATQRLTFAEELAAKRKQLEVKVEKRKREKTQGAVANDGLTLGGVPEITIIPASGKSTPSSIPPTKMKEKNTSKDKTLRIQKPAKTSIKQQQRQQPQPFQINKDTKVETIGGSNKISISPTTPENIRGSPALSMPPPSPKHKTVSSDKK